MKRPLLIVGLSAAGLVVVGLLVWLILGIPPNLNRIPYYGNPSLGSKEIGGPCDASNTPSLVHTVDYLIIGGGPAGLATADDLALALRASGVPAQKVSIAIVEKRSVLGGNLRSVSLVQPSNYNSNIGYGPLRADIAAQRVNVLTLTEERRRFTEFNITMYCSPFRNIINSRERREICSNPSTFAGNGNNNVYAYGDFCTYRPSMTDPETGAYRQVRSFTNFTGCTDYTNAGNGKCTNFNNNDPSYSAYEWLIQGGRAPEFDSSISGDVNGIHYAMYDGNTHPLDPNRGCTVGQNCPIDRCLAYPDWRSYVAGELSLDAGHYNNGYANFLQADNVGFFGDYEQGFGACSYINYQSREWNTASINCYPKSGMTSLVEAMKARAQSNGVTFFANETVTCIQRKQGGGYQVRTTKALYQVNKFLFIAAPTPTLLDPTVVGGNVVDELRSKREMHRARAQKVASVVMQWAPGTKGWWFDTGLFDLASGNWSTRTYGDTGCFSRIEIIDTPQHRCTNAIRAIYSDHKCRALWTDLIETAAMTQNWSKVQERVLVELRDAFPEAPSIPTPVMTYGEIINSAWYWSRPQDDDISNEAHANWAASPLGTSEPLCLTSESVHIYYQGWAEGALRSSRQCLSMRFANTTLGPFLEQVYQKRTALVPGDGSWASANFQDVPPALGEKHFPNELWWPYDYSSAEGDYCDASKVAARAYPTTDAGY